MATERVRAASGHSRRKPAAPALDPALARVLHLQRSAGNRAVARLLAREEGAQPAAGQQQPWSFSPFQVDPLKAAQAAGMQGIAEKQAKAAAYVERERQKIEAYVRAGWSMAELIDLVRKNVPETLELVPSTVEDAVRSVIRLPIADRRRPDDREGVKAELVARVRNASGKAPQEPKIENGWVHLSVGGIEAGVKKGDVEGQVEAGLDKIGLKIGVGRIKVGAEIEPPDQEGRAKWSLQLAVAEEDAVPAMEELGQATREGVTSVTDIARSLASGKKLTADEVRETFKTAKEAVEKVSATAKAKGITFGIKAEGQGPDIRVQATLTIVF